VYIAGYCGVCGAENEVEINLISPTVRQLQCKNIEQGKCYNRFEFVAHIYEVPEIKKYAQEMAIKLKNFREIAYYGDNYIIKFLLHHNIFNVRLNRVIGMGSPLPDRWGQYVFSDNYGNYTPNSKLYSDNELISMNPDAVIVALMPPLSRIYLNKLADMGYDKDRIYVMCPEEMIPEIKKDNSITNSSKKVKRWNNWIRKCRR
jgi:hypothetical protein